MNITNRSRGGVTVLDLQDSLDIDARKFVVEAIDKVDKDVTCHHLVLNLDGVTFMDSVGLGMLVMTYKKFEKKQRKVSLLSPKGTVKQALDLCNLHTMIPIYESEAQISSNPVKATRRSALVPA